MVTGSEGWAHFESNRINIKLARRRLAGDAAARAVDRRAGFGERARDAAAGTAGCAGHERHASGQRRLGRSLPRHCETFCGRRILTQAKRPFSAHVPGSIPPAFSRSAFSWSDLISGFAGEHVGIGGTTIVTMNERTLAGGAVCDFQSRAESIGFSR